MRVIIYSWASTAQRLLSQCYGVHCWCSVVKMFTICVTLPLLWTLMEPSNIKAWGWGTKTQLNRSTLKSLLAVYYIRKSWHWTKNGSKPKQSSFRMHSRGLHGVGFTQPWRSSSELSGTAESFRYWDVALIWTQGRSTPQPFSSSCQAFKPHPYKEPACGSEFPRKQLRLYKAFLQGNFSAAHLPLQSGHKGPESRIVCAETKTETCHSTYSLRRKPSICLGGAQHLMLRHKWR